MTPPDPKDVISTVLPRGWSFRPRVVCLCGSCRFKNTFIEQYAKETDAGRIVLSVGRFMPQSEQDLQPEHKRMLDELHKRKIDLSDEILVLNVGGYIGDSTKSEIKYAVAHGKLIRWLEPIHADYAR